MRPLTIYRCGQYTHDLDILNNDLQHVVIWAERPFDRRPLLSDLGFCPRARSVDTIPDMWRTLMILLWLPLHACTYVSGDSRVLITSQPAGAEILVDGENTGLWTPRFVDLGGFLGSGHEITLRKPGFEQESRQVFHYSTGYTSRWIDGGDLDTSIADPFFWTIGDTLTPFGLRWQYVPHELYVTLYRDGEAPVQNEPGSGH